MRTRLFFAAAILLSMYGCVKDHKNTPGSNLGTTTFSFIQSSSTPFNGAIEVFPCRLNSSSYYGNYLHGELSVINPSYVITNGVISSTAVSLLLPLGSYTIIYWGIDNTPSYQGGVSRPTGLTLNTDFSTAYWTLRTNPGRATYKPAYNQVMAVKNVTIGSTDIEIALKRVVAGLNVVVQSKSGTPFGDNLASFDITIDGVSNKLNYLTGQADMNSLVSVKFPLTIATNRDQASNLTAMLYPSKSSPQITLTATLVDGSVMSHTANLTNSFVAGEIQTVTIVIDQITGGSGEVSGFTVSNWTEVTERIDFGTI